MRKTLIQIKDFLTRNQTARQTVAKNTFWMGFGEAVSRVLRAAVVIVAARLLGPDEWGVFAYAINIAAMFTIVTDLGINAVLVKEASREPEKYTAYLSTSLFIKLALVVFGVILIIFAGPYAITMPGAEAILPIVAFILIFDGLREFFFSITRALEKMESEAVAKILTNLFIVFFSIAFLLAAPTSGSLAWSYLAGSALGFVYTAIALRKYLAGLFTNFSKPLLWPIFSQAWPFAMVGLFGTIMTSTDIYLLGFWVEPKEVGLYSAANRVLQLLYMFPSVFATSLFPVLARTAKNDISLFGSIFSRGVAFIIAVSLPIAVGGIILARPLMHFLYGIEFVDGYTSLRVLLLTLPIAFAGATIVNAMYAADRQKAFLWMLGTGAILNAVLDIIFIPKWGGPGSAFATLVAQMVSILPGWIILVRHSRLPIWPRINKPVMASVVMGVAVYALAQIGVNLPSIIVAGGIIYAATLVIIKDETVKEILGLLKRDG